MEPVKLGTNYYLWADCCQECGRSDRKLHIGKASGGWAFALHVIPEEGLNTLEDWKALWAQPNAVIFNEYDDVISSEDLLRIIVQRQDTNRNKIDGVHCIGHGPGPWDYCVGEFS